MAAKSLVIRDNEGKEQSQTAAISKYFRQTGETVADFMAQMRKLSPEAKEEMAIGAAKQIGWTVEQTVAA